MLPEVFMYIMPVTYAYTVSITEYIYIAHNLQLQKFLPKAISSTVSSLNITFQRDNVTNIILCIYTT